MYINRKKYTREEVYALLMQKGQTIPYEKTRKSYKKEVKKTDPCQIYTKHNHLFAVV